MRMAPEPSYSPGAETRFADHRCGANGLSSLPFDGSRALRAEVVEHAADAGDFGEDAVRDLLQDGPVDLRHDRGHGVAGIHRTDDHRPVEHAFGIAHARGSVIRHDGKELPDGFRKAGAVELLAQDGVGFAERGKAVAGDRAGAADAEAGSRERLAVDL